MFNSDSMYKAYERRISKLPEMDNNISREDYMASEVEMQIDKRKLFSRSRVQNNDKDVTHINERNRIFNAKLERNYAKYSNEIKGNLERGSAM